MGRPRNVDSLNAQEAAFVKAFLAEPNGTKAAIAAGYSPASAASQASRMLKRAKIRQSLKRTMGKAMAEAESTAEEVVRELRRVGMVDPVELVDPATGCVRPLHEIPEAARRAIASIEVEELFEPPLEPGGEKVLRGYLKRLRFWNKNEANKVLAQKHGLLVEKHEVEAGPRLAGLLAAAAARKGAA